MHETTLYAPVKAFFTALGFTVRGEVDGCDLVARRDDDLVVVELKKSVNLTLVLQGVDRKTLTDSVYLAVAAPRNSRSKRWREVVRLCRLLGLGLLAVRPRSRVNPVEVLCEPSPAVPSVNSRRKRRLVQEFSERSGDFNVGGSAGRPLVTAYREEALRIAHFLSEHGPAKLAAVREATGCEGAGPLVQRNVYGWFRRVSRGVYELTPLGAKALEEYRDVLDGALRAPSDSKDDLSKSNS